MVISKKRLLPLLVEKGFIETPKSVSFEAYGRTVEAYIDVKDMATRYKLEAFLKAMKLNVSLSYSPGRPVVAVQVSYFKAWHWDE